MDIYKKASKFKLRVQTQFGELSAEQLWDLKVEQLDTVAVKLEEEYKVSGKKSFLATDSKKDKLVKLKFNLVLDILETKVADQDKASKARNTRARNNEIDAIIALKQKEKLHGLSEEELLKLKEE